VDDVSGPSKIDLMKQGSVLTDNVESQTLFWIIKENL